MRLRRLAAGADLSGGALMLEGDAVFAAAQARIGIHMPPFFAFAFCHVFK